MLYSEFYKYYILFVMSIKSTKYVDCIKICRKHFMGRGLFSQSVNTKDPYFVQEVP